MEQGHSILLIPTGSSGTRPAAPRLPHPSSAQSYPEPYFPATRCQVTPLQADPLVSPAKFLVLSLLTNF